MIAQMADPFWLSIECVGSMLLRAGETTAKLQGLVRDDILSEKRYGDFAILSLGLTADILANIPHREIGGCTRDIAEHPNTELVFRLHIEERRP